MAFLTCISVQIYCDSKCNKLVAQKQIKSASCLQKFPDSTVGSRGVGE